LPSETSFPCMYNFSTKLLSNFIPYKMWQAGCIRTDVKKSGQAKTKNDSWPHLIPLGIQSLLLLW